MRGLLTKVVFLVAVCLSLSFSGNAGKNREKAEEIGQGESTARGQSTFTFQVQKNGCDPFLLQFTHDELPFDVLTTYTQGLITNAHTLVTEFLSQEEDPVDRLEEVYAVFQNYWMNTALHTTFKEGIDTSLYQECERIYGRYKECETNLLCQMLRQYEVNFKDVTPSFIWCILEARKKGVEEEISMKDQIACLAVKQKKKCIGLDSILDRFILLTNTLQRTGPLEKMTVKEQEKIRKDISQHLSPSGSDPKDGEKKDLFDRWAEAYKNGNFFQYALLSDEMKTPEALEHVAEVNRRWLPRVTHIISAPELYPSPVMVIRGDHHGFLQVLEEDGFALKILNQQGAWYSFSYTQLYAQFQVQQLS